MKKVRTPPAPGASGYCKERGRCSRGIGRGGREQMSRVRVSTASLWMLPAAPPHARTARVSAVAPVAPSFPYSHQPTFVPPSAE
jgi:hypothetical protein